MEVDVLETSCIRVGVDLIILRDRGQYPVPEKTRNVVIALPYAVVAIT